MECYVKLNSFAFPVKLEMQFSFITLIDLFLNLSFAANEALKYVDQTLQQEIK